MKRILLSLLTCGLLFSQGANAKQALATITQDEFIALSKKPDTVVIDVRTPREYAAGHIPGAINRPHRDIVSGKINFEEFVDKKLVLYCHTGVRVGIVDKYSQRNPLFPRENMLHLQGDFRAWQARGKPINKP